MVIKLEHGNVYQLIATTTRNQNFCPNLCIYCHEQVTKWSWKTQGNWIFWGNQSMHMAAKAWRRMRWPHYIWPGKIQMAANGQKCSSKSLRQVSGLENWRQNISGQNTLKVWSKFHYCGISGPHTTTQWALFSFSRPKYYLLTTHSLVLPNSYRFTVLPKNFSIFTQKNLCWTLYRTHA